MSSVETGRYELLFDIDFGYIIIAEGSIMKFDILLVGGDEIAAGTHEAVSAIKRLMMGGCKTGD